jgi:hypothetical protein
MAEPLPKGAQLAIIRLAFTLGVLALGAVVYFLTLRGLGPEVATADQVRLLTFVAYGVWGIAITALIALRWRMGDAIEAGTRSDVLIVGWVLGESVAVYGGVFWLLTHSPALYGAGLVVFAAAFILFPLRPR